MNWKIISCIIITCLIFNLPGSAQKPLSENEALRLGNLFPPDLSLSHTPRKVSFENELQLILTGSFHFYKEYISPQDAMHCTFYPSCSEYALRTIQLNGFLGVFDAIDRLSRCNGFSPEKYEQHHEHHLFYDPVRKIK